MGNEKNSFTMTGLKGSHPLGALAAFGLLRCCADFSELGTPRLHWELADDWLAVLTTEHSVTADELISLLAARMSNRSAQPEFKWADDLKSLPEQFISAAREAVKVATPDDRGAADFFAAYGSEFIQKDGKLRPTAFYMTSGQQTFLKKGLRELAESLTPERGAEKAFHEALFGPWRYQDSQHPLGWDPAMERLYALRAKNPSPDKKRLSVRAAVWLAAEALPLFPCAVVGSALITRGFTEMGSREAYFSWPVWRHPLSLDAVRATLALKALTQDNPPLSKLRARGIAEVFRSYRTKTGGDSGDYKIFRTARPCTETEAEQ